MLEIFALWALTKRIGQIVEQKGRKSGGYKVLTVVLWFGGELIGLFIGLAIADGGDAQCVAYIIALIGAAIGAGIAYWIANSLSPVGPIPGELASLGLGEPTSPSLGEPAEPSPVEPASPGPVEPASPGPVEPASPGSVEPESPSEPQ